MAPFQPEKETITVSGTGIDRWWISLRMQPDEVALGKDCVALVLAAKRAAVGEEMLGGGGNPVRRKRMAWHKVALEAEYHRAGIAAHHCRILRITFIAAAPARILWDRESRRECPLNAGRRDFAGGNLADAADQVWIVRRAEPDVVRENRRAGNVAVPVNGVHPKQDRDRNPPFSGP